MEQAQDRWRKSDIATMMQGMAFRNVTPQSLVVMHIALQNRQASAVVSGVFGQRIPDNIETMFRSFRSALHSGTFDSGTKHGQIAPRRSSFGDIDNRFDIASNVASFTEIGVYLTAIHAKNGFSAETLIVLDRFQEKYLAPHLRDGHTPQPVICALVLLVLYSVEDFVPLLHRLFSSQISAGAVQSLYRYRLNAVATSGPAQRDFNYASVVLLLRDML